MAGYAPDASTTDWCTPERCLERVRRVFPVIHLDPCSNPWSKVGALVSYQLPEHDGLVDSWDYPTIFFNPPFGKGYVHKKLRTFLTPKEYRALPDEVKHEWSLGTLEDWVARGACAYTYHGSQSIGLIPAYTDTGPWQNYVWPTARAVCFHKGRIKFDLPPVRCQGFGPNGQCEELGLWYSIRGKGDEAVKSIMCNEHKAYLYGKPKKWGSDPAPMACAFPYWGDEPKLFKEAFEDLGHVQLLR